MSYATQGPCSPSVYGSRPAAIDADAPAALDSPPGLQPSCLPGKRRAVHRNGSTCLSHGEIVEAAFATELQHFSVAVLIDELLEGFPHPQRDGVRLRNQSAS